jgi:protein involved in polysaccharide export with SLBB domain
VTYRTGDKKEKIDLQKLFKGRLKKNFVLQKGASIYIPQVNQTISILGEINKPGSYKWYDSVRLTELMAQAGNHTEKGDIKAIRITHSGGESETVNLNNYFKNGIKKSNPVLESGDTVIIPELEKGLKITVLGEVKQPGLYKWEQGLHLADLIAQAGNTTEKGNIHNVQVKRANGKHSTYNINKYFKEDDNSENPLLKPGDTVLIKERSSRVVILGEVNRPGSYSWHKNLKLSDLLAQAGNQTKRGDLEKIKIIHEDGNHEAVNLERFLDTEKQMANPSLKPGDIVVINELDKINWTQAFSMISGLTGLKQFLGLEW